MFQIGVLARVKRVCEGWKHRTDYKATHKMSGKTTFILRRADCAVQEYIKSLRSVGSSVNTWVVMVAAEGIIPRRCPG